MNETAARPGKSAAPQAASEASEAVSAPAPVARSIGERLRAGRERSGLSVAAAAEKLHLDIKVIEALEADRFAEMGASVYVRGHLKRYADFVGEPGAELVSMYSTRESRANSPDLTQAPHPERRTDPRRFATPLIALCGGAVLLGAIWWVLAGSRGTSTPATLAETAPVVVSEPAPAPTPDLAPAIATPASLSGGSPILTTGGATQPASSGAPVSTPPPVKEAPAREISLRLELTNDSWVEVYNSRGERLFYDVASAGSVQSVSGRGPLRVVLGNASGVSVQVDGQAREIPAGAVDGEGANFVVNRTGSLSRAR
jgi:cytoskeleton protein RodZ